MPSRSPSPLRPSRAARLACVAALAVIAVPALGDGATLGLGPAVLHVSSSQLAEDRTLGGFRLFFGYRGERLGFELSVTGPWQKLDTLATTDIYYPPDRAEFSVLDLAVRFDLLSLSTHRVAPWVQLGYGFAFLNWQTFAYSQGGTAVSLAAGADVRVAGGLFLRGGLTWISAGTHDGYDNATPTLGATTLFVAAGWQFGLPPLGEAGQATP